MLSHELAYASLTISGDTIVPEFWTSYFGVQPDIAVTKGQVFITSAGRTSRIPGRTGVWGLRSNSVIRSDQLEPHLRYLIERLALPRADLRRLVENADARMRFFCYWMNERGDRTPDIPEDIKTMMESLGGTIEIDEYR